MNAIHGYMRRSRDVAGLQYGSFLCRTVDFLNTTLHHVEQTFSLRVVQCGVFGRHTNRLEDVMRDLEIVE